MPKCPYCRRKVHYLKEHIKKAHKKEFQEMYFEENRSEENKKTILKLKKNSEPENLIDLFNQIDHNNTNELYEVIKIEYKNAMKDIEFNCLQCGNCCNFSNREMNEAEIGLYQEDLIQMEKNNVDMNGCICTMAAFDKRDGTMVIDEELNELKKIALNFFGYEKFLRMITIDTNNYCNYYDRNIKKCKIHNFKPLICFTYPFTIENTLDLVGVSIQPKCKFIQEKIKEYGSFEEYRNYIDSVPSFYQYTLTVLLYLKSKERVILKDRRPLPKREGYDDMIRYIQIKAQEIVEKRKRD